MLRTAQLLAGVGHLQFYFFAPTLLRLGPSPSTPRRNVQLAVGDEVLGLAVLLDAEHTPLPARCVPRVGRVRARAEPNMHIIFHSYNEY